VTDRYGRDPACYDRWVRLGQFYASWLRLEVEGLHNVPAHGPALIVGNHGGFRVLDQPLVAWALRTQHPERRMVRTLMAAGFASKAFLGWFAPRYMGCAVAHPEHATYCLSQGELVLVFPEGGHADSRSFRDRHGVCEIPRFGTGFARVARQVGVPIVPVAIRGLETAVPTIYHSRALARLAGLTRTFGPPLAERRTVMPASRPVAPQSLLTLPNPLAAAFLPFPVKCRISFGPPLSPGEALEDAVAEEQQILAVAEETRARILHELDRLGRRGRLGRRRRAPGPTRATGPAIPPPRASPSARAHAG
jgi:1-acyl-sn-glycerol-3-phosphate acyltransferase